MTRDRFPDSRQIGTVLRSPRPRRSQIKAGVVLVLISTSMFGAAFANSAAATSGIGRHVSPSDAKGKGFVGPAVLPASALMAGGAWAAVPMGHLGDPLNTFWQLFFRATGKMRWVNEAPALEIATNGGLLLGPTGGQTLVAGVRPANRLDFTSFAAFTRAPGGPSAASPLQGAATQFAAGPGGARAAIVGEGSSASIETAPNANAAWTPKLMLATFAKTAAAQSCGPTSLTTVGYVAGGTLVFGATCHHAGVVGLFQASSGTWRRMPVVGSIRRSEFSIASIIRSPRANIALLVSESARDFAIAVDNGTAFWTVSKFTSYPVGATLRSVGPVGDEGAFVLFNTPGAAAVGNILQSPAGLWAALPRLPVGVETLAAPSATTVTALAVAGATMRSYDLDGPRETWSLAQTVQVGIIYGSSS